MELRKPRLAEHLRPGARARLPRLLCALLHTCTRPLKLTVTVCPLEIRPQNGPFQPYTASCQAGLMMPMLLALRVASCGSGLDELARYILSVG